MNNRFRVWPYVRTRGIYIQDDDQWVGLGQLRCLHHAYVTAPSESRIAPPTAPETLYSRRSNHAPSLHGAALTLLLLGSMADALLMVSAWLAGTCFADDLCFARWHTLC